MNENNRFYIRKNNTYPFLIAHLKDEDGFINLTNTIVTIKMVNKNTSVVKVYATVQIDADQNLNTGKCVYQWQVLDTDTEGTFNLFWEIDYQDGRIQTVPTGLYTENIVTIY